MTLTVLYMTGTTGYFIWNQYDTVS